MDKKLYLIYVPGLGDSTSKGQRLIVKTWSIWGAEAELVRMNWAGKNESWEDKLARLLKRIDALNDQGKNVALVGASAGASAVINAFNVRKDKVLGCVLIAGKVNHPEAISGSYSRNNPSFVESANSCKMALASMDKKDRSRIFSRYGFFDEIVPKGDSIIEGARNQMVPTAIHGITIASQLIFGVPSFLRFFKTLE